MCAAPFQNQQPIPFTTTELTRNGCVCADLKQTSAEQVDGSALGRLLAARRWERLLAQPWFTFRELDQYWYLTCVWISLFENRLLRVYYLLLYRIQCSAESHEYWISSVLITSIENLKHRSFQREPFTLRLVATLEHIGHDRSLSTIYWRNCRRRLELESPRGRGSISFDAHFSRVFDQSTVTWMPPPPED